MFPATIGMNLSGAEIHTWKSGIGRGMAGFVRASITSRWPLFLDAITVNTPNHCQ